MLDFLIQGLMLKSIIVVLKVMILWSDDSVYSLYVIVLYHSSKHSTVHYPNYCDLHLCIHPFEMQSVFEPSYLSKIVQVFYAVHQMIVK